MAAALLLSAVCSSVSANIHHYSFDDDGNVSSKPKSSASSDKNKDTKDEKDDKKDTRKSELVIIDDNEFYIAQENLSTCNNLLDATINTGYDAKFPSKPFKLTDVTYSIVDHKTIQAKFVDPDDDEKYVIIRKGKDTSPVSDDMTAHPKSYKRTVEKTSVVYYGNSEKKIYTVTWTKDGFNYSIRYSKGVSISSMQSVVSSMIKLNKKDD